jgi:hypothetical protein
MPAMSEPKSSNPESSPRVDMRHSEVRLTDTTQQVRLKPDPTHEVRLKPDPTYVPSRECKEDAMICERCGKAEMYRMHAVWRCPECGFKTDCCGW